MPDAMGTIEPPDEPVLFDAVLFPHRSLSPAGFWLLISIVAGFSFAAGMMFVMMGAWPVFGFFGVDVLLLAWCFRRSYWQARLYETVRLTERSLTVRRVDPGGEAITWTFQPYWLRIEIDDPPRHESQLTLASHGRRLTIGSFLAPEERADLARALRTALESVRAAPSAGMAAP